MLGAQVLALDIDLDQSSYRVGEQINFYTCENISFSCLDNFTKKDVQDGCAFYGIETRDFTCSDPAIIGEDSVKDIVLDDFEGDLEQYLPRPLSTPLHVARQVYAKSLLGENYDEYLLELRDVRREREKCFGVSSCDLELTTGVLRYLSLAGVNRSNRVYHDGLLWLESRQNKDFYEDWFFSIRSSDGAECELASGDSVLETYTINGSSQSFTKDYSATRINSTCDKRHCLTVYDYFGERIYDTCASTNSSNSFQVESGCWYDKDRLSCSNYNTARALTLNHLEDENYNLGTDWADRNIARVPIEGEAILNSRDLLGNIFFYEATGIDRLKTWIWYSQNNDGSFAETDSVYTTLEAARVFENFADEEWVQDAYDFLIDYRGQNKWSGLREEVLGYYLFNSVEPPITSRDLIYSSSTGQFDFEFQSDAGFNTQVFLSDELDNITDLEYSAQGNFLRGNVTLTTNDDGIYTGHLTVINSEIERNVPVVFENMPSFDLSFEDEYYFEDLGGSIDAKISKSDSQLSCNITFNDYFQDRQVNITRQERLRFDYSVPWESELEVNYQYVCTNELTTLSDSGFFRVWTYTSPPFSVSIQEDMITTEPGEIIIENNWDHDLMLKLSLESEVDDYAVEELIELPQSSRAYTYITRVAPSDLGLAESNAVKISARGFDAVEEFEILLNENVHEPKETVIEDMADWTVFVYGFLFFIAAGVILFLFYLFAKKSNIKIDPQDEKSKGEQLPSQQANDSRRRERSLAESLIAVDKAMGADDSQIRKDVSSQGYADEEIDAMLKELESMETSPSSQEDGKKDKAEDDGEKAKAEDSKSDDKVNEADKEKKESK